MYKVLAKRGDFVLQADSRAYVAGVHAVIVLCAWVGRHADGIARSQIGCDLPTDEWGGDSEGPYLQEFFARF
jgi:hypothetical protein